MLKPRHIWERTTYNQETGCWDYRGVADSVNRPVFPVGWLEVVFASTVRPIAEGETVWHKCANGACANPRHLTASDLGERD